MALLRPKLRCGQPDADRSDGRCCWPWSMASQDIARGNAYRTPTCLPASELGGGAGGLFRWITGGRMLAIARRLVAGRSLRLAGGASLAAAP